MTFLVYRVDLTESASDSRVKAGDDFAELVWVPLEKITEYELTPPSISLFLRLGWLTAEQALQQRQFTDANQHPVAYTSEEISWRVSVYAVIIRDGQLLCIKNKKEELFDLIGGGIEFGENLEEAMYREGLEEAGAKIKLGRHLETSIDWFFHKRGTFHQTLQLFYRAELIGELMDPTDPDIESVEWISLADVGTKYHFPPVVERILLSEGRKES
jgi:8-oxo-dGTP pyrophosphatase MutT (NUDIX family)